jgi:hypothetical protein
VQFRGVRVPLRGRLALIAIVAVSGPALAQSDYVAESLPRPSATASKLLSTPTLDGRIAGDSAWEGLAPATGFTQVQPNEGEAATQKTEVFLGYTETAFYIGVVAYDDDPSRIIVSDSRRDSSLDETDSFRVIIDGLLDRQNGYIFGTNPAGVQYDAQVIKEGSTGNFSSGGGGFNLNWDGSWNVKALITDTGWSAEMEIPFTTLRYGKNPDQVWGINFQRNIRDNNEIVYWAPISIERNLNRVSAAGTVDGISPPATKNLQITPYALTQWTEGGDLRGTESEQDVGVDLKYSVTPSLTLDVTVNTDFAQVESDEFVVNLDRFSIFLPEKRPFFLENAGQFTVGNARAVELFFSRRIGIGDGEEVPIAGGVRLSGKVGAGTNLGFLYMSDEGLPGIAAQNDFIVARVNQELPNRSSVGALIVSREGDGSLSPPGVKDENQTYSVDGRWGVGDNLLFEGWIAKTETPYLTGDDYAYSAKMDYDSSTWASRLNYTEVAEDFNPEVGFLRRDDYTEAEFFLMRRFRPDDLWGLLEVRPHITFRDTWDLDGFLESGLRHYDVQWEFKNGYRLDTAANELTDGLVEEFEIIEGVFVQPGTYSGWESSIIFHTNLSKPLSFRIRTSNGKRFGGDRTVVDSTINFRVGETFSTEFSVVYNDFDLPIEGGDFSVTLSRARISYSFTPQMLLQALVQYNDDSKVLATNLRFSMLRTANTGLFIVYNEFDERLPDAAPKSREVIIKYTYLFDVFK